MKCLTPQISWHSMNPVFSVDFQNESFGSYRLATSAMEPDIKIWQLVIESDGNVDVVFLSNLRRHNAAVNVTRFSPDGELLASGDVERNIYFWKRSDAVTQAPDIFGDDDAALNKETWHPVKKTLHIRHCDEVFDLCWSPDSRVLASASVDRSVIITDVEKGVQLYNLHDFKRCYAQGVAWDPVNEFVACVGPDRCLRLYDTEKFGRPITILKASVPDIFEPGNMLDTKLFHDESTILTFFRRLSFSPDGNLLAVPMGCVEKKDSKANMTHVFARRDWTTPCMILPSGRNPSVVVAFSPLLYSLRPDCTPLMQLPYRMIFAVATTKEIILYDTQQATPFGYIADIHYEKLTDLAWSGDGRVLMVSSIDGYCSIVCFGPDELGTVYEMPLKLLIATPSHAKSSKKKSKKSKKAKSPGTLSTPQPQPAAQPFTDVKPVPEVPLKTTPQVPIPPAQTVPSVDSPVLALGDGAVTVELFKTTPTAVVPKPPSKKTPPPASAPKRAQLITLTGKPAEPAGVAAKLGALIVTTTAASPATVLSSEDKAPSPSEHSIIVLDAPEISNQVPASKAESNPASETANQSAVTTETDLSKTKPVSSPPNVLPVRRKLQTAKPPKRAQLVTLTASVPPPPPQVVVPAPSVSENAEKADSVEEIKLN